MIKNQWAKRCDNSGPNCVEVMHTDSGVRVRNSTNPAVEVAYTLQEWTTFLAGAKAGEFDL